MLLNLHIKNLALIEEIDVYFDKGLNILTGETGAGKSIILGSINLALGSKIAKDMVRDEAKDALVELLFQIENAQQIEKIKELDIPIEEDGQVLLSRKLVSGKTITKVNGKNIPLAHLKELAELLIDIHGQHEHQSLLHRKKHLEVLDEFGKEELTLLKQQLQNEYRQYISLKKEIAELTLDEEQRLRELDFLTFEIQEIKEASIKVGEDIQLEEEYKKMKNGKKITGGITQIYKITGYDAAGSVGESIGRAIREFSSIVHYDEKLADMNSILVDVESLLNDLNRTMSDYINELDFSQEYFVKVEDRLDVLNKLKAKYGRTLEDVIQYQEEKEVRLNQLIEYESFMKKQQEELQKQEQTVAKVSNNISKTRKKYSVTLCEEIKKILIDLNFQEVEFKMEFQRLDDYTANGYDEAGFLISTNPSEPMKPLGQIVSGGELSRIMLAIKTLLADKDAIETLIFDEVDVGISGRTAQKVSEKMAHIAKSHQVICITHLPQIAAMADVHYAIEKHSDATIGTTTAIRKLDEEEIIQELARILGGAKITDKVMDSAKEMKMLAKKFLQHSTKKTHYPKKY